MKAGMIEFGLELAEWLATSIPKWISAARAKGELTAEQEADYQQRQADVFAKDYAQPEPEPPAPTG